MPVEDKPDIFAGDFAAAVLSSAVIFRVDQQKHKRGKIQIRDKF
jgi:hypothetical protein